MHLRIAVVGLLLCACGGATPEPTVPGPTTAPSSSVVVLTPDVPTQAAVSVVRFDDLGVSFAVPPGFHVVGDDDLSARIRASANPRLTAALESRASQKKGLPLLTLSKETSQKGDGLTLTLTATVVPPTTTPAELLTQQQAVMKDNLATFAVTDGPREHVQDGVAGIELADRYGLRGATETLKMASVMRLHVRAGLAITLVAVWPESAPTEREVEAHGLLDGLHFYAAQP